MEAADRRQYVKRYYTGAVLSGGFRTSPAGPEDKAVWYHGIYHFPVCCGQYLGLPGCHILSGRCIKISHVPFRFMVRGLKAIIFLLLISVSFNLFLTQGEVLFQLWFLKVTKEGLKTAGFMGVRLIYLVVGSSVMTLTTTPNELTDGLEKSLGFLKKIGLPVHEVSMMMSIALRFIPILVEETDKIMKAQMARGADFESGNIIQRAKNMIPLLVPLFISAFRRATDLAMAMEARCYRGGEGRTKMKPLHYAKRDGVTYLVYIAYLAVIIVLRILI